MRYVDAVAGSHVDDLVELFRSAWWAEGRDRATAEALLAGSDVVVGVVDGDRLVGFCRALTDWTCLALVLDVVVTPDQRGTGIGAAMVEHLLGRVRGVASVELVCQPERVAFYERLGFSTQVGRSLLMRVV